MTPEQAIKLLTEVVSQVPMAKQGHINCEIALNTLAKLIPRDNMKLKSVPEEKEAVKEI